MFETYLLLQHVKQFVFVNFIMNPVEFHINFVHLVLSSSRSPGPQLLPGTGLARRLIGADHFGWPIDYNDFAGAEKRSVSRLIV